jgi:hypothetical protein
MQLRWLTVAALIVLLVATSAWFSTRRPPHAVGANTVISPAGAVSEENAAPFSTANVRGEIARPTLRSETDPLARFDVWAKNYVTSSKGLDAVDAAAEGLVLAKARRAALRELIQTNPEKALAAAVPWPIRHRLPRAIQAELEDMVGGRGDLAVVASFAEGATRTASTLHRRLTVGQRTYRAFVYGARSIEPSRRGIAVHGIAIDDLVAVSESPLRILAAGEPADSRKRVFDEACAVSAAPIAAQAADKSSDVVIAEVGDEVHYLCSAGHVQILEKRVLASERAESRSVPRSDGSPVGRSVYTEGPKTLLYLRVRFANQPASPQSAETASQTIATASAFIVENSYCKTSITGTVSPVYVLPHDEAWYTMPANDPSGYAQRVLDDARLVAANPAAYPGNEGLPAYNYFNYDFEAVRFTGAPGSFSGQGYIGARGVWLKSDSGAVLAHELGHNFGLFHANRWSPNQEDVLGPGTNQEYGDVFDSMGQGSSGQIIGGRTSFNAGYRTLLEWLPAENVRTIETSGEYRLHAFDTSSTGAGQTHLLKIPRDLERDYWVEYREQWPDNRWTDNGVQLRWSPWSESNGGSQLLDTQPGASSAGAHDAAVVLGRTFSDPAAGVHITPLRRGNTTPESIDVAVRFGPFPGNRAPDASLTAPSTSLPPDAPLVLSATATDADGDDLAYYWQLGNDSVAPNEPSVSATWSLPGHYNVLVTVSDLKGGVTTRSQLIKVGSPSTFTIAGTIRDNFGRPAAGVRVHNGVGGAGYRETFTDSEGSYVLTNLAAGTYTLGAASSRHANVAPDDFANPVTLTASLSGYDFTAAVPPPVVTTATISSSAAEAPPTDGSINFERQGDAPLNVPLTINFEIEGTAAADGSDYSLSSHAAFGYDPTTQRGSITLAAGESSALLTFQPINDAVAEGAETIVVTLLNSPAYTFSSSSSVTVTIADDDAHDAYTEIFTATKPFDLAGKTLTFTPADTGGYRGNLDPASGFAAGTAGATVLAQNGVAVTPVNNGDLDDGFWKINVSAAPAQLFGATAGQIYVNTNGAITFNAGDSTSFGNAAGHFRAGLPRISAYWRDLDPSAGGRITCQIFSAPGAERTVITYENVPFYGAPSLRAHVQIELWSSGRIAITWLPATPPGEAVVGLSQGTGTPTPFFETDFTFYPPTPRNFADWKRAKFEPAEIADGTVSGELADCDRDGLTNLLEYACGREPKVADAADAVSQGTVDIAGERHLALTFVRARNLGDLTLAPQFSSDLSNWSEAAEQVGTAAAIDAERERVTFRDVIPISAAPSRFARLKAETP